MLHHTLTSPSLLSCPITVAPYAHTVWLEGGGRVRWRGDVSDMTWGDRSLSSVLPSLQSVVKNGESPTPVTPLPYTGRHAEIELHSLEGHGNFRWTMKDSHEIDGVTKGKGRLTASYTPRRFTLFTFVPDVTQGSYGKDSSAGRLTLHHCICRSRWMALGTTGSG